MEIWKKIIGYEFRYEVSDEGLVRSFGFNSRNKVLRHIIDQYGYKCVNLCKNGHKKRKYIHRLVAEHFIDNPENKPQINHIDGDIKNNSIPNLEWVTNTENQIHSYRVLGNIPGKIKYKGKIAILGVEYPTMSQAAKKIGVHHSTILRRCASPRNKDYVFTPSVE